MHNPYPFGGKTHSFGTILAASPGLYNEVFNSLIMDSPSCVTQGSKVNNFSGITVKKIPTMLQNSSILSRKVTKDTFLTDFFRRE